MIKIILTANGNKSEVFVSEDATLREVLDQNRINYSVGVTQLDGYTLKPGELDKTFAEHGITETCYLSVVVKSDNAAKVTVVGEAAVITSALKLEDIKTAKKFRPEALQLLEDKKQVYAIDVTERSSGAINGYGATFSNVTDAEGHATITLTADRTGDIKEMIQDKIGLALLKLKKVEDNFAEALAGINADKAAIAELIEVQ